MSYFKFKTGMMSELLEMLEKNKPKEVKKEKFLVFLLTATHTCTEILSLDISYVLCKPFISHFLENISQHNYK